MVVGLGKMKNLNHYTKNQTSLKQSEAKDYNEQGTLGEAKTHYSVQYWRRTRQEKDPLEDRMRWEDVAKKDVEELGVGAYWKALATDRIGWETGCTTEWS